MMADKPKRPPRRRYFAGRHASICNWSLKLNFRTKAQAEGFINSYLAGTEIPMDFRYYCVPGDSCNPDHHVIKITGTWANNLRDVAKLAQWWDFSQHDDAVEWRGGADG